MSLRDRIDQIVKTPKDPTKLEKLLEVKADIEYMIKNKIPLSKQINLLIEEKILSKISISEYRNILIKNFGYEVKTYKKEEKIISVNKVKTEKKVQAKEPIQTKEKIIPREKSTDILSQELDMNQFRNTESTN